MARRVAHDGGLTGDDSSVTPVDPCRSCGSEPQSREPHELPRSPKNPTTSTRCLSCTSTSPGLSNATLTSTCGCNSRMSFKLRDGVAQLDTRHSTAPTPHCAPRFAASCSHRAPKSRKVAACCCPAVTLDHPLSSSSRSFSNPHFCVSWHVGHRNKSGHLRTTSLAHLFCNFRPTIWVSTRNSS